MHQLLLHKLDELMTTPTSTPGMYQTDVLSMEYNTQSLPRFYNTHNTNPLFSQLC